MIDKYLPEAKKSKQYDYLKEKWSEVYNHRKPKVGKKKAIYSANAVIYSELLKEFTSYNDKLYKRAKYIWEQKEQAAKPSFEEKMAKKYNIYPVDDMNVILSTEEDLLKDAKKVKRKGMIKNLEDEYEIEVLDKASDEYNIKLHPSLYYVMWSE